MAPYPQSTLALLDLVFYSPADRELIVPGAHVQLTLTLVVKSGTVAVVETFVLFTVNFHYSNSMDQSIDESKDLFLFVTMIIDSQQQESQ